MNGQRLMAISKLALPSNLIKTPFVVGAVSDCVLNRFIKHKQPKV